MHDPANEKDNVRVSLRFAETATDYKWTTLLGPHLSVTRAASPTHLRLQAGAEAGPTPVWVTQRNSLRERIDALRGFGSGRSLSLA